MTSVKEFRVETAATPDRLGRGAFVFTDDYSVFDWGKMPDAIPNKGASLCAMGAANFERLETAGLPTHYRGVVAGGEVGQLEAAVEVVFRNTVPVGSSLRGRADPGEFDLEYDRWPDEPVDLPGPVVEFSTKFEESDRYLDRETADAIAGTADVDDLERIARAVNDLVTETAAEAGLKHEDGKIECLYADGEVRVADVVGTFDENRFAFEGQQLSKEVLRQYHKRTRPGWVEAIEDAKAAATAQDVADWRSFCDREPEPLADHVIVAVRDMYAAGANAYIGRALFDAPPLSDAVETVRAL
ncbi:phosphoribosylaminoimidazolesuccinocarboxamide synthase [Halobacteriales archaeon SW_12_69_24]|nr:MAG: phosphoribosylaminoimidazolesuccinocarboxamide synthase [Halobacteriales archaeon SW_12_69_24]